MKDRALVVYQVNQHAQEEILAKKYQTVHKMKMKAMLQMLTITIIINTMNIIKVSIIWLTLEMVILVVDRVHKKLTH